MATALPTTDELAVLLSDEIGWFQGSYEIAAHLESLGFSDEDARRMYAHADVFALAQTVFATQSATPELQERAAAEENTRLAEEEERFKPPRATLLRTVVRGAAYGMPMGITLFASVILLYALWAYYYFSPTQATAIGLGTALSYFVAGGFTQAIGRRGLSYLRQEMYLMTLKVGWFFVAAGLLLTAAIAAVLIFVFNFFTLISQFQANLAVLYFVSLSTLWLCLAMLYMLEQELSFSAAVALGVGVVYLLREFAGWEIVWAHQVGLLFTAALSMFLSTQHLWRRHRRQQRERESGSGSGDVRTETRLPRTVMLLSSVRTYLLYGALYFALLFADRLLAWTGRMEFRQTFIWFRADYEAGLNWALMGMLPAFAVLEYVLLRFGGKIKPLQLAHGLQQRASFSAWYMHFYVRQVLLYFVVAVVGVVVAYFGMLALIPRIPELAILNTYVARFTFAFGVFGYLCIGFSLLNLSVFFWLSRPRLAMLALVPAILTTVTIGYLLSRMVSYHLAVVGFAGAGIVFAVISTVLCMRVMSNLDYYYYSAF